MLASPSDAPCACMQPADSSSEGDSDDSESDLHERLRELKGLAKEREKGKKLSRAEQTEKNLFSKNKGAPLLSVVEELIVQCNCAMTVLSCADLCMCLRARRGVAARGLRSALLEIEQQRCILATSSACTQVVHHHAGAWHLSITSAHRGMRLQASVTSTMRSRWPRTSASLAQCQKRKKLRTLALTSRWQRPWRTGCCATSRRTSCVVRRTSSDRS